MLSKWGEKEGEERNKDPRSCTNITLNKKNYQITKDTWEEAKKCKRKNFNPSIMSDKILYITKHEKKIDLLNILK